MALRFSGMRAIVALAATALVLTACGGTTNTPTSKTEAATQASPTSSTTSSTPTPILVPGRWGDTPPSRDAIEDMARWAPTFVPEVKATVDQLWSDFDTAGDIMIRDGKILTDAGF